MADGSVDLAVVGRRVLVDGTFGPACVLVRDGKILDIVSAQNVPKDVKVDRVDDRCVLMPGLVDSHVHVNEPGRTEWEGFHTATRAAAAGGVTTIIDMPLNCIPVTTTLDAFQTKLNAIDELLHVDCGFYGGVVPGNEDQLPSMVKAGVVGFKCFLIHSGIDDFPNVTRDDLELSMPVLAKLGVPLLVHAELDCKHGRGDESQGLAADPKSYEAYLASRPRQWENDAIRMMIDLVRKHKCRVHIVHLSSSDALDEIRAARKEGLPISVETCPHYLTFASEDIPDGDTRFKCAPPIRERQNSELLWAALSDGTIDFVVSDHSPCTPELKLIAEGDFKNAWGGIASLQFGFSAVWTQASRRGIALASVNEWMSGRPAQFVGLDAVKGRIAKGFDADLIVFDPERTFVVEKAKVYHKHKETPHEGRRFSGVVERTYVRGQLVYESGSFSDKPLGVRLFPKRKDRAAISV